MQFVLQKDHQEAERKRVEAQGIADHQLILSRAFSNMHLQYERIKAQQELAAFPKARIVDLGLRSNGPSLLMNKKGVICPVSVAGSGGVFFFYSQ